MCRPTHREEIALTGRYGSFGMAPLLCAIGGGVLALGTMLGQENQRAADDVSPMAGMDHSSMAGMDHSSMPGMDHSSMAGMDHSSMAGTEHGTHMPMGDSTPDMRGHQPAVETPGMDMTQPGMAAAMPGGVHAECQSVRICTAIFAQGAIGTADVAGSRIRLLGLAHGVARLDVDGQRVSLRSGKPARLGALTLKPIRISVDEVAVQITRRAR